MTVKNFILDTNVLLHDPNAIYNFQENNVIIPLSVIEEIDTFKKELSELGRNARTVARSLDKLRENNPLSNGVTLPKGGTLKVAFSEKKLPIDLFNTNKIDNHILSVALEIKDQSNIPTILVTQDINLRIKADALGLQAENYDLERVDISELYSGFTSLTVCTEDIDKFYEQKILHMVDECVELSENFIYNQFIIVVDENNPFHTALGYYDGKEKAVKLLTTFSKGANVWGIKPRNKEQTFAFDLLLNDNIKLVTLVGKAGTGKTLLAIAAGLFKTVDAHVYTKLTVARSIFPLGKDIGYLPGNIEEKLNPWMKPIFDNLELIISAYGKKNMHMQDLFRSNIIEVEPLTYIRGRSMPKQYIIIDEAQNLTPHEVKTIITRVGDNTKIVLTGDPYQIDNPYVDASNNGLIYTVNRFKNQEIAGHINLIKGERSILAELAANLL